MNPELETLICIKYGKIELTRDFIYRLPDEIIELLGQSLPGLPGTTMSISDIREYLVFLNYNTSPMYRFRTDTLDRLVDAVYEFESRT